MRLAKYKTEVAISGAVVEVAVVQQVTNSNCDSTKYLSLENKLHLKGQIEAGSPTLAKSKDVISAVNAVSRAAARPDEAGGGERVNGDL